MSEPSAKDNQDRLNREQQAALERIRALWDTKPRDAPNVERAVAHSVVAHRIPVEHVTAALGVPYARVVRIVKRVTGKMPSALAIMEARAEDLLTQQEMITLLSNREYDPPVGNNTGVVDVRNHPNSVSVLQQAYLRGLVTQGELWAIGDSITIRKEQQ